MRMIDLFSGLGGASAAFKGAGWEVITVDNDPKFNPTICVDVREWRWSKLGSEDTGDIDLIWASPPCTYFARYYWRNNLYRGEPEPSMELVETALEIIKVFEPKWWVLENVRGAREFITPLIGHPPKRVGSYYLWGKYPVMDPAYADKGNWQNKPGGTGKRGAKRAEIPYHISYALLKAIEAEQDSEKRGDKK